MSYLICLMVHLQLVTKLTCLKMSSISQATNKFTDRLFMLTKKPNCLMNPINNWWIMSENYLMENCLESEWNYLKIKGISSKLFSESFRKCLRKNWLLIEFSPLFLKLILLLKKSKQKIHPKVFKLVMSSVISWEHGHNKSLRWWKKEKKIRSKPGLKLVIFSELKSCMIA